MIKDEEIKKFISGISIYSDNKTELYNIIIPILLSRKVFKNSTEKKEFIENVLGLRISDYAYRSKTILVGKVLNEINNLEIENAFNMNRRVKTFLLELINANKLLNKEDDKNNKNKSKKDNKNSLFTNWSNYIDNMDKNRP